jgi:ABC-2 type transport system permease protein
MSNVWWIVRRELESYLRSPIGYIIICVVLVLDGLFFNAFAIGSGARKSSEVLEQFFYFSSGSVLFGAVLLGMRLIAAEHEHGTFALLATSPVREWQLVLGKYLSALAFLAVMAGLTFYMPLLVMVNGKVSLGHILAGYLGVLLIGGAGLAVVLVCSALAPNQLVAAVTGGAVVVLLLLLWLLSRIASPPVDDLIAYLSIHDKHFRPFMRGIVSVQDVLFYVSFIYVSLLVATRVVEARRWR